MDKKHCTGILSCFTALLLLIMLVPMAAWADSYNATNPTSIVIQLQNLGTPMGNVAFKCYQVGQLTTGNTVSWELVPELQGEITLDLNDLHEAGQLKQAAADLARAVSRAGLTGQEATSDSTGLVEFTGLNHGVYLVVQTATAQYGTTDSFLAAVPYTDDTSTWQYTLQVAAKGARLPEPTPDEPPTPPSTPTPTPTPSPIDSPKTGDNSNLSLWAAAVFLSGLGLAGLFLASKGSRKE